MAFGSTPADINNIPIGCVYVPGVGFKALQGGTVFTDASSNDSAPVAFEAVGGNKATYSAAITGLVPATAATDIFTLTGSASKLVKVTRIAINVSVTLATTAVLPITLLKRSSADLTGTSTAPTRVAHDSLNPTVTATCLAYTANPGTLGTLVGAIRNVRVMPQLTPITATEFPMVYPALIEEFGSRPSQSVALRGTAEVFAVNLNAIATITGWLFDISIEWTEE